MPGIDKYYVCCLPVQDFCLLGLFLSEKFFFCVFVFIYLFFVRNSNLFPIKPEVNLRRLKLN